MDSEEVTNGPLPTSDGHHDKGDLLQLERAMRLRWNVPAETRRHAMEWLSKTIDPASGVDDDLRERVTKLLLDADRHDLRVEEFLHKAGEASKDRNPDENPKQKRIILEVMGE